MAQVTLTFGFIIESSNFSVKVGDTAYYTNPQSLGGFSVENSDDNIVLIGTITSISNNVMVCDINATTIPPSNNSYIFFSKDRSVNVSSVTGYYGEAAFYNNSRNKAEMFSATCDIGISSK